MAISAVFSALPGWGRRLALACSTEWFLKQFKVGSSINSREWILLLSCRSLVVLHYPSPPNFQDADGASGCGMKKMVRPDFQDIDPFFFFIEFFISSYENKLIASAKERK